jgi:hypothetical protein
MARPLLFLADAARRQGAATALAAAKPVDDLSGAFRRVWLLSSSCSQHFVQSQRTARAAYPRAGLCQAAIQAMSMIL